MIKKSVVIILLFSSALFCDNIKKYSGNNWMQIHDNVYLFVPKDITDYYFKKGNVNMVPVVKSEILPLVLQIEGYIKTNNVNDLVSMYSEKKAILEVKNVYNSLGYHLKSNEEAKKLWIEKTKEKADRVPAAYLHKLMGLNRLINKNELIWEIDMNIESSIEELDQGIYNMVYAIKAIDKNKSEANSNLYEYILFLTKENSEYKLIFDHELEYNYAIDQEIERNSSD